MSETKRNQEDMENGEAWGMFSAFYSTNIEPKLREKAENRREDKKGKGKGKATQTHWAAPDYEHAGVGIAIHNKSLPYLKVLQAINSRIMYITLNAKGGNISLFLVYAPTATHSSDSQEDFYEKRALAINEVKGVFYIGGDYKDRKQARRR